MRTVLADFERLIWRRPGFLSSKRSCERGTAKDGVGRPEARRWWARLGERERWCCEAERLLLRRVESRTGGTTSWRSEVSERPRLRAVWPCRLRTAASGPASKQWVCRWRWTPSSSDGEYWTTGGIGWWESSRIGSCLHCSANAASLGRRQYKADTALLRPATVLLCPA